MLIGEQQAIREGICELLRLAGTNEYVKGFRENTPFKAESVREGSVEYYHLRASYVAAKLALVHSEVSEALEEIRKPLVNGEQDLTDFGKELADIVIRVGALADLLDLDLGKAIVDKMDANSKRTFKHGGKLI